MRQRRSVLCRWPPAAAFSRLLVVMLLLACCGRNWASDAGIGVSITITLDPSAVVHGVQVAPASSANSPVRILEGGPAARVWVSLSVAPSAEVVIPILNPAPTEVQVSATTLTFTPVNWAQPQAILLASVADGTLDGSQTVTIKIGPISGTSQYAGYDPEDIYVLSLDAAMTSTGHDRLHYDCGVGGIISLLILGCAMTALRLRRRGRQSVG
jgi:hypothetical protein